MKPGNLHIADLLPIILLDSYLSYNEDNWFVYFWAANGFFKMTKCLDLLRCHEKLQENFPVHLYVFGRTSIKFK